MVGGEGTAVKNAKLSARELDMLITWIVGGTPHGDLTKTPPPVKAPTGWTTCRSWKTRQRILSMNVT